MGGLMTVLLVTGVSLGTVALSRTGSLMGPEAIAGEPEVTDEPLDISPTEEPGEGPWSADGSDDPLLTLPSEDPVMRLAHPAKGAAAAATANWRRDRWAIRTFSEVDWRTDRMMVAGRRVHCRTTCSAWTTW